MVSIAFANKGYISDFWNFFIFGTILGLFDIKNKKVSQNEKINCNFLYRQSLLKNLQEYLLKKIHKPKKNLEMKIERKKNINVQKNNRTRIKQMNKEKYCQTYYKDIWKKRKRILEKKLPCKILGERIMEKSEGNSKTKEEFKCEYQEEENKNIHVQKKLILS